MKLFFESNKLLSDIQYNNHLKLYEQYIDKFNTSSEKLFDNKIDENYITDITEDMQYNLNGIILHELYFSNIASDKYDSTIKFEEVFENVNFEKWKNDFKKIAKKSRGWVIFCYDIRTQQYLIISLESHDKGIVCGCIPLIVLDVYEHAYYTDYGNDKEAYIDIFIDNIDMLEIKNRKDKIK